MNDKPTDRMPMVLLATLKRIEKKDGSGSFFAGRMGSTKVLMFRDTKAEGPGEQWRLLVQEQSQEEKDKAQAYFASKRGGGDENAAPRPRRERHNEPLPTSTAELNDEVPF